MLFFLFNTMLISIWNIYQNTLFHHKFCLLIIWNLFNVWALRVNFPNIYLYLFDSTSWKYKLTENNGDLWLIIFGALSGWLPNLLFSYHFFKCNSDLFVIRESFLKQVKDFFKKKKKIKIRRKNKISINKFNFNKKGQS